MKEDFVKRWSPEDLARVLALAKEKLAENPLPASLSVSASSGTRGAPVSPPAANLAGPAMKRAALLSRFRYGAIGADATELGLLESVSVPLREGDGWRSLFPEQRSAVLGQMSAAEIRQGLAAQPLPTDPLQMALRAALEDLKAADLLQMNAASLASLLQVHEGLSLAIPGLPPRATVERKLELARLLDPMRTMTANFSGRDKELQQLRDYVGVLPPSTWIGAAKRFVATTFFSQRQPPFLIAGPGGVGKTTLAAQFILEHALVGKALQFPFAYLDFDRPSVNAQEPATLLIEAVRQIGLQYEAAALPGERLRQRWESQLRSDKAQATPSGALARGEKILGDFASFLTTLEVGEGPVLILLDTFEEVQLRSARYAQSTLQLIGELSVRIPRLRVVIAGRAEVPGVDFADKILLKEFDPPAAAGYLRAKGVDPATAEKIAKEVGGSPLALTVALALFRRDPDEIRAHGLGLDGIELQGGLVQAQLFDRILLHIKDPEVRKLAHPGLALRRVTPELIRDVLAGPCDVAVPDDARAQALFEKLKEDVTLFVPGENANVLVHRPDLRRLMLKPLRQSEPAKVEAIHRLAVDHYVRTNAKRTSQAEQWVARAEEVYHRLALGQSRQEIGPIGRELEPYLASAMEELAPPEQAILAEAFGLELPPGAAQAADQETWERAAARRVRELMDTGDLVGAGKVLLERSERSTATDLRVAEVTLLGLQEQFETARQVAMAGIEAARGAGNAPLLSALLLVAAEIEQQARGDLALADLWLTEAAELGSSRKDVLMQLRALVAQSRLARAEEDQDAAEIAGEIARLAARTRDADWARELPLLRDVVGEAGVADPALIDRAGRLGALELTATQQKAIASFSSSPGGLDSFGLEGDFSSASVFDAEAVVAHLREESEARSRIRPGAKTGKVPRRRPVVRLAPADRRRLTDLLQRKVGAGLGSFLEARLQRGVEAVSFALEPERIQVLDVVRAADQEGWLEELVIALLRSRFDDPDVLHFADHLGLGPTAVKAASPDALSVEKLVDFAKDHRGKLGALEARTCTVEAKGEILGAGFLVGPRLVLTPTYARFSPSEIGYLSVRFDQVVAGKKVLAEGLLVRLAPKKAIFSRGMSYAVLQLESDLGRRPLDSTRADPEAHVRGFVTKDAPPLEPSSPLLWLWREQNGTFLSGIAGSRRKREERSKLSPAANGAPVVDGNCSVVGMCSRPPGAEGCEFVPIEEIDLP